MRNHFTIENCRRALQNPRLIWREVHRLLSLPFNKAYGYYVDQNASSVDVMSKEWDNLFILDACRADYFETQHRFEEPAERVIAPGKMSWEFMQKTFLGGQFYDTIYITSNPFATRLPEDTFFKTEYLIDEWDNEVGTIHPEDVVAAGAAAHEQYPNKRLILHFMQPHRPYLGPMAEQLRERVNLKGYRNQGDGVQIWGAVKEKQVSVNEVRQAYAESLDIVLSVVEDALSEFDGKTAITADHGEMLGERVFPFTSRVWGHSEGFSTLTLREVPWLVVDGDRREVSDSPPVNSGEDLGESEVRDRLQALGYSE